MGFEEDLSYSLPNSQFSAPFVIFLAQTEFLQHTVPVPIKDAASIQTLFFQTYNGSFHWFYLILLNEIVQNSVKCTVIKR